VIDAFDDAMIGNLENVLRVFSNSEGTFNREAPGLAFNRTGLR